MKNSRYFHCATLLLRGVGIWLFVLFMATPGSANDLAAPTGPVLLTVTGELGKTNDSKSARFDEAMLAAFA